MKKFLILLLIVLAVGGTCAASYLSGRTVWNDENAIGNTPGNLLNGGLFCENDGKIYFSNQSDRGALYVMDSDMTNYKKLFDDNCSYLNVTNKYVVYVRDNHKREAIAGQFFNLNTLGIYRIDKKSGKRVKQFYAKPAGFTSLKGNTVYYQHYNSEEGLRLHKIGLDGKNDQEITKEQIIPASFIGNRVYYNGIDNEHDIHAMDLTNHSTTTIYSGNCYNVTASKNHLYFLSLSNNYAIARTDLDGSNPEIIVSERCSFFNLSEDESYLYYQVDGGDHNRICRMDLSTLTFETIMEGDYNSIHVTSNFVFFRKFGSDEFYYIKTGDNNVQPFTPEVFSN